MEEEQRNQIIKNLSQLVKNTNCNTTCLAVLLEKGAFSEDDEAYLNSIPNEMKKSMEFYKIIMKKEGGYKHLVCALTESCQSGALAILNVQDKVKVALTETPKASSVVRKPKSLIRFDVLRPTLLFTGRERELAELHQKLKEIPQKITWLVGLGGTGKTELARAYIQKYDEDYDGNIIWLNAQAPQNLKECFRRLASYHLKLSLLNHDGTSKATTTIVDEVYSFFQGQKSIFIFDNADDSEGYLSEFMPCRVSHQPYILITSLSHSELDDVNVVKLKEMKKHEAIEFMKKGLQLKEQTQDEDILELVNRLQRNPLAISQTLSDIRKRKLIGNFNIKNYLGRLQFNAGKILNSKKPAAEFNSYGGTMYTAGQSVIDLIYADKHHGIDAMQVLSIISYFQPGNIKTAIFNSFIKDLESAFKLLLKHSMINFCSGDNGIVIEWLAQEITRKELRHKNKEKETLRKALQLLSANLDNNTAHHAGSVCKFTLNYPDLQAEFGDLPWRIYEILY